MIAQKSIEIITCYYIFLGINCAYRNGVMYCPRRDISNLENLIKFYNSITHEKKTIEVIGQLKK